MDAGRRRAIVARRGDDTYTYVGGYGHHATPLRRHVTPSTRREEGKRTPSKTQRLREVVVGHRRRLRDGEAFLFREAGIMVADNPILQLLPHREITPLVQRFLDI